MGRGFGRWLWGLRLLCVLLRLFVLWQLWLWAGGVSVRWAV